SARSSSSWSSSRSRRAPCGWLHRLRRSRRSSSFSTSIGSSRSTRARRRLSRRSAPEAETTVEFLTRTDSLNVDLPAAETRSRLDAILNLCNDGILIISLGGTIEGWNRAAEEIYGYTAEEIVGKPLAMLVPQDRLHELS